MIANELIQQNYFFRVKKTADYAAIESGRFLFNQTVYLRQHQELPSLSFELWNTRLLRAEVLLHVSIKGTEAVSPFRATFGGIEMLPALSSDLLDLFIQHTHAFLSAREVSSLKLTNHPFAYDTEAAQQISAALLRQGHIISHAEINYHLDINSTPLEPRLHSSERRRLRKCREAKMIFAEEVSPDIAEVYAFISAARKRKGFPVSLTANAFKDLFEQMPDVYRIFTVRKSGVIAALTVTVRINETILYNFYPADSEAFLSYSPTVLLVVELYNLAAKEGYQMLDLGIATVHGKPNYGLMQFKRHLSALPSVRLSFQKTFS